MSVNVEMMENKIQQSFSPVDKIQTNLTEGKTQNWVPENEANKYIKTKSFSTSENGEYVANDEGADAFSEIKINVAGPEYHLGNKQVTENGVYQASADGFDAYSEIKAEVETPGTLGGDYTLAWQKISSTGYGTGVAVYGSVIEFGGAIYTYDSNGAFKTFNGTAWTALTSLPVTGWALIFVFNNQIHAISDQSHYVWNGTAWTLLGIQNPERFNRNTIIAFVDGGLLHILHYDSYRGMTHWSFNGTAWAPLASIVSGDFGNAYCAYRMNDETHVLINGKDYIYSNDSFRQVGTWGSYMYGIGNFTVYDIDKALGNAYVRNGVMQLYSFNNSFARWEENPDRTNRNLSGNVCSVNKIPHFVGQSAVYRATVIQQAG